MKYPHWRVTHTRVRHKKDWIVQIEANDDDETGVSVTWIRPERVNCRFRAKEQYVAVEESLRKLKSDVEDTLVPVKTSGMVKIGICGGKVGTNKMLLNSVQYYEGN